MYGAVLGRRAKASKAGEFILPSRMHRIRTGFLCSVRAWRGLRFNEEYAAKLKKQRQKKAEKPATGTPKMSNPFSVRFSYLAR
jgi:hypothetical protein